MSKMVPCSKACGYLMWQGSKTCWTCRKPARSGTGKYHNEFSIPGWYYDRIERNAKRRDILFRVTHEEMAQVFDKQDGKCALTGLPIHFTTERGLETTASCDRINSDSEYVWYNIQFIHKDINHLKSDYRLDEFIQLCKLVARKADNV